MKGTKRILAMLLCVVMVVGLIPASVMNVFAADETIYVMAGGDYQKAGDPANSAANVTTLLDKIIEAGYTKMDGFLFVGDYDAETHNDANATAAGITSLMNTVQSKYSNIGYDQAVLIQGNHDYKDSRIDATGGQDFDGYSVYALNEDDYPDSGGTESGIKAQAAKLETWLHEKQGESYDAPIFVISHLPLAYGPRTYNKGDGKYAKYLFDVLNEHAEEGLNIIYMHGHDHAYGADNYLGGEAIYLPVGDQINIAEVGSTTKWTVETLNFTYMNAGYVGYYDDDAVNMNDGDGQLTMSVFAITDGEVKVERYSKNGLYNLKSAGRDGYYGSTSSMASQIGLTFNTTVRTSPQMIELTSAPSYGNIGSWVGVTPETPADDVTTSGNSWVELIAPVPGTSNTDDVTTSGNGWTTITKPTNGTTTYTYELTDTIVSGGSYLIGSGNNGRVNILNSNGNTISGTTTNGVFTTTSSVTDAYKWTFTGSGTSYTIQNVSTGGYLYPTASRSGSWSYSLETDGGNTSVDVNNNSGALTISRSVTSGWRSTTSYMTSSFGAASSGSPVYIYKIVEHTSEGTNGLYGKLDGNLTYNVTAGTSAEAALAAVKNGIAIKYATAADYSNEAEFADDGEGMSWVLDRNYDPNVPGDYAVTISYNGTVLGVAEVIVTGTDVNGTYYKLSGELSYVLPPLAGNQMAIDAVKDGITAYKYDAMATPGDNVTGTEVKDSELTWTLDPNFDISVPGDYAVTISYNDITLGTAKVIVPATTTYYVAEGNGLYIVSMNTSEANAMAAVKDGVTVYSATSAEGANKTAISDDNVTWNWVDKYNGADSGPYTVEILKDDQSLGTVEVKVDIQYETGVKTDWTYIGETEATGGTMTVTYTLDTDGIDYGEEHKYIIVDDNEAIVLNAQSATNGTAHSITISGNTATLNTRDYEYHMIRTTYNGTRYELITKGDGSQYLYQESNGVRYGTRSSVKFQVNHHGNGVYDIHDIDGTNWYIIYNGSWTVTETTSARVRLYKYTSSETVGGTPGGPVYALIEGNTIYSVTQGSSATKALAAVKAGITGYTATDANGTGKTELADSDLTWKWKNTFNGNSTGSYWVEISYQGKVLGTVEVRVEPGVINNYPEYPDEGAVKVNKTATGVQFQSSGVAQVEVSASGVPAKKGADVVIVVDTSSSMTNNKIGNVTRLKVLQDSMEAMLDQFVAPDDQGIVPDISVAIIDFNSYHTVIEGASITGHDWVDDGGQYAQNNSSIFTGTKDLTEGAFVPAVDLAENFVVANNINTTYSGTDYDDGLANAYELLAAKKAANEVLGEDRDLYMIFMSDGVPFNYNYFNESQSGSFSWWNDWLDGKWADADAFIEAIHSTNQTMISNHADTAEKFAYFYNGNGSTHPNRLAEAIKGDPYKKYDVIVEDANSSIDDPNSPLNGLPYTAQYPGLGATVYSIGFGISDDSRTPNSSTGYGGTITLATVNETLTTIASSESLFYSVQSKEELDTAFTQIVSAIAYAASNARFVDQMGDDYNLQMAPIVDYDGDPILDADGNPILPSIEIISYDIWTRQDYLDEKCTIDQIGVRKGTSTVLETVTFTSTKNADGTYTITGAYSDKINNGQTNILADGTQTGYIKGVIYAQTFLYNTNITGVAIDGVEIPTDTKADGTTTGTTNILPSETFYWKMGTVQTSELAMRYYVYLTGSMEGTRPAGSYATNEFAILYYDNYLGNACAKPTVSPVVAWKSANVSYAFYLVNDNGEIIVNQTTGATGTFANKIAVTNPVVYEEILLNNSGNVQSIKVAAISDNVLPKYYTLYDEGAVYTIQINSDASGDWVIKKGDDVTANSTYVTGFTLGTQYSNDLTMAEKSYDYTHTTVWFAVKWEVQAHPDAVVVDYGLPVNISVLGNDMFGDKGALDSIGTYDAALETVVAGTTRAEGFGKTYTGKFGVATVDANSGKVKYQMNTTNGMQMDEVDKFTYAVYYSGTDNPGYYYDSVTVIPATNIYYEESFLAYSAENTEWVVEGTAITGATQDEDRPGRYSLTDANNIYGYDKVNLPVSEYSLGTAKKVTVDADSYATAEFTFTGTGCDIVAMTSSDTGVLIAQVYQGETLVTYKTVDTYYGVAYQQLKDNNGNLMVDGNGNPKYGWVPVGTAAAGTPNEIYQVPVLKFDGLNYGTYTVKLTASYYNALNHEKDTSYDLYIDAVRIYNPAGTEYGTDDSADGITGNLIQSEIQNAYDADGERWPVYYELRNLLIGQGSLSNVETDTKVKGMVFIDGDASVGDASSGEDQMSDYISYGPNNEVYLAPGQRVAFKLNEMGVENVESVHIGLRSLGGEASYTFVNIAATSNDTAGVKAGDYYNPKTEKISTATDMLYDMTAWKDDIIVISNYTTDTQTAGCLAITNIKITFKSDPNAASAASLDDMLYVTPRFATMSLRSMNANTIVETPNVDITEPEIPEVETPEVETPEVETPETGNTTPGGNNTTGGNTDTEVEDAVPGETEPEVDVTEPEVDPTEPETDKPAEDIPEEEIPEVDPPAEEPSVQQNFWTGLWNAIKSAFSRLFGWA